jgi:hypothetical protein
LRWLVTSPVCCRRSKQLKTPLWPLLPCWRRYLPASLPRADASEISKLLDTWIKVFETSELAERLVDTDSALVQKRAGIGCQPVARRLFDNFAYLATSRLTATVADNTTAYPFMAGH